MKIIKVLSIDGGGIRGIIPAIILSRIEELTKNPIHKLFDIIAGTSTGGILALGLTKPAEANRLQAEFKASDLIKIYSEDGKRIFYSSILQKISSIDGIIDERYPSNNIEEVLQEYFNDAKLSDSLTPVLIPSYETEGRSPFFFKSEYAKDTTKAGYDFPMWQVARAASAAPTYFQPFKIETSEARYSLIDGGVFANNPAMCAFSEVKTMFPQATDFLVVSLGTGELTRELCYNTIKDWGVINWAQPMLNVVFDGISDTVDYYIRQILPDDKYYRFQVNLKELGKDDLDDASEHNIYELQLLAENLIAKSEEDGSLFRLCNYLTDNEF